MSNNKTLSTKALTVINDYLHFKVGFAVCSVPYFNNKTLRARAAPRSQNGKGDTHEIYEELMSILFKDHVDPKKISSEALKKILTDKNIGIDCSGFAYHILDAESLSHNKSLLRKHIHFINCHGPLGKIKCRLRPIENCDVSTFAHEKNSEIVDLKVARPADMITMLGGPDGSDRNHILVVHHVEYSDELPTKIHYSHAVAYPKDGVYGTGIRQGLIEINNPQGGLLEQTWLEEGQSGNNNPIFIRAQKSQTELRRLKLFINNHHNSK